MKTFSLFSAIALLVASFFLALPDNSEAARLGGGRSFGGRPSMSQPAHRPAQRQTQATPATPAAPSKPGMFGGMGGMLGGFLAGSLLGSLLSGNGFNGGGFMDIILLGILAFIAYRLYQRFKANKAQANASPYARNSVANSPLQPSSAWDRLSGDNNAASFQADPTIDVPAGFDVDEFLKGAKMAYNRLQKSWDKRDLDDIANFATPAVMQELKAQLAQDPNPGNTEIMLVNAQLLGVENEGADQRAQVYFDVLMRESPAQPAPENAREIWHFLREGKDGSWKLDGIQQVE